jgi:hypothetical protein
VFARVISSSIGVLSLIGFTFIQNFFLTLNSMPKDQFLASNSLQQRSQVAV